MGISQRDLKINRSIIRQSRWYIVSFVAFSGRRAAFSRSPHLGRREINDDENERSRGVGERWPDQNFVTQHPTSSTAAAHFFWIVIGTAQSVIYLYLYRNDGCIACFVISCSHSGSVGIAANIARPVVAWRRCGCRGGIFCSLIIVITARRSFGRIRRHFQQSSILCPRCIWR